MIVEEQNNKYAAHKICNNDGLPVVRFVGMHNKPGMKPLDSKTVSGKVIDIIISRLPFECSKTNLCEIEYPTNDFLEIDQAGILWYDKYEPKHNDIIVLLGGWVHDNFLYGRCNIVKLPHPASKFSKVNREKYVATAVERVLQFAG